MKKVKTIKLSDGYADDHFRVEQLTDSLAYRTGQLLDRKEVDDLCRSSFWKVTIVRADKRAAQ